MIGASGVGEERVGVEGGESTGGVFVSKSLLAVKSLLFVL